MISSTSSRTRVSTQLAHTTSQSETRCPRVKRPRAGVASQVDDISPRQLLSIESAQQFGAAVKQLTEGRKTASSNTFDPSFADHVWEAVIALETSSNHKSQYQLLLQMSRLRIYLHHAYHIAFKTSAQRINQLLSHRNSRQTRSPSADSGTNTRNDSDNSKPSAAFIKVYDLNTRCGQLLEKKEYVDFVQRLFEKTDYAAPKEWLYEINRSIPGLESKIIELRQSMTPIESTVLAAKPNNSAESLPKSTADGIRRSVADLLARVMVHEAYGKYKQRDLAAKLFEAAADSTSIKQSQASASNITLSDDGPRIGTSQARHETTPPPAATVHQLGDAQSDTRADTRLKYSPLVFMEDEIELIPSFDPIGGVLDSTMMEFDHGSTSMSHRSNGEEPELQDSDCLDRVESPRLGLHVSPQQGVHSSSNMISVSSLSESSAVRVQDACCQTETMTAARSIIGQANRRITKFPRESESRRSIVTGNTVEKADHLTPDMDSIGEHLNASNLPSSKNVARTKQATELCKAPQMRLPASAKDTALSSAILHALNTAAWCEAPLNQQQLRQIEARRLIPSPQPMTEAEAINLIQRCSMKAKPLLQTNSLFGTAVTLPKSATLVYSSSENETDSYHFLWRFPLQQCLRYHEIDCTTIIPTRVKFDASSRDVWYIRSKLKGAPLHYDLIDGFLTQFSGRKVWVAVREDEAKQQHIHTVGEAHCVGKYQWKTWLDCSTFIWFILEPGCTIFLPSSYLHATFALGSEETTSAGRYYLPLASLPRHLSLWHDRIQSGDKESAPSMVELKRLFQQLQIRIREFSEVQRTQLVQAVREQSQLLDAISHCKCNNADHDLLNEFIAFLRLQQNQNR